ncbi:MAG: Z1 domain-containing protein [Methylotenera sp.]|nr:Z1 domain-containing protein [Methylotenera sp.]
MNNSYQRIKDFIFGNLRKQPAPIPDSLIRNEIDSVRKLINQLGLEVFARFLADKSILLELSNGDWERMEYELETQFDVKMAEGFLIKDTSQTNRDPYWWTSKVKQTCDSFYWDRYENYLNNTLNDEVIKTINKDTDVVMDNIEDPSIDTFSRYGMVVGHVQSGKTGNYSALICKAADAGYNFIVVIAGGMNNLRDQTQERLNESFVGQDMGQQVGVGIGNVNRTKLPISLTTKEKDFNKQDADKNAQGLNFDNIKAPILLVIKKNTKTLSNVIGWLEKQYKNQIAKHSMLVIDDESDYASINTKEENDPTKINERIRKLISLFKKSAYVAYTATPYANIFIDHQVGHDELGKDLFPRDFIYALDAPTNYFGARKIFLDPERKNLIPIDDYLETFPQKHKKDWYVIGLPESLKDATRHFLLNIAIRYLRGQGSMHNSMLVHASRFTNVHQRLSSLVESYLNQIKREVKSYGKLADASQQSSLIADIKKTYDIYLSNHEFEWEKVLITLTNLVSNVVVREVHQSTTVPLVYRKDMPTNAIVIGGTSLSRGYTLEGLSISYFLRNTVFYDTLMQMGRWFGYRTGYEDLCKIYLPDFSIESFGQIIEATEDLIDDFKRMSAEQMTPEQFGLAVKYHPDSGLQVTARNKQKNAKDIYFEMKLDGHSKETAWLIKNEEQSKENIELIASTLKKINLETEYQNKGKSYLWKNVSKSLILDFLTNFNLYDVNDELGFRTRMPIKFILKYVEDVDSYWDVALYSGEGDEFQVNEFIKINKEKRQLNIKGDHYEVLNRQVSSGSAESIVLDPEVAKSLASKRKDIRMKMNKPLLMIHLLQNSKEVPVDNSNTFAAFGISFPGGINSGTEKTVKLKINKVYLENINDLMDEDSDD